MGATQMSTRNN